MKKIVIVIPVFNEDNRLQKVISQIKSLKINLPIVIVDDGSDNKVVVNSPQVTVLRHKINLGKGAAMKTGADYVFNDLNADAVIFMDGDLQHNPINLNDFLRELNNEYDLVISCRQMGSKTPLIRLLGNKFASWYMHFLFGIYISDILSGYRALTKNAYRYLKWDASDYAVETEMIARLGKYKKKIKWTEIPISSLYVDKYKGVTLLDGISVLFNSFWWKFTL